MSPVPVMFDNPLATERLIALRERVRELRQKAADLERLAQDEIAMVHCDRRVAARNLVDYLALRECDIREVQQSLFHCGLSSLGVAQGHVMASFHAIIRVLDRLCSLSSGVSDSPDYPAMGNARQQLEDFTNDTLGASAGPGLIRIMVTMPSEAASEPSIIESLLDQGMTVMRVNCAHDGAEAWEAMLGHLDSAKKKLGKQCRVAFDLGGPKLRTGPIAPGPEVLRFKPIRDSLGYTVAPATIRFSAVQALEDDAIGVVPIDAAIGELARAGDEIHLKDTRDRDRILAVVDASDRSLLCTPTEPRTWGLG